MRPSLWWAAFPQHMGAFPTVRGASMAPDRDDYLNGSHSRVRVDAVSLQGWSEDMSYLEGMYEPLTPLEDDVEGGPTVDSTLRAEADLHTRQVDAAGFMLDHVYAVEGTVSAMRAATAYAAARYPATDEGNADALAAAAEREATHPNPPAS